jgi:hypothetical protein
MRSNQIIAATAAFAGFAAAQSTCSRDIKISEPTPSIDCDVVDANIEVDSDVAGELVIDGPKQIKGDLIITNATELISISSTTINSIKNFELDALEKLSSLSMDSLETITNLKMLKLNSLRQITFGSEGVTKAEDVLISDTDIQDLSGLKLTSVKNFKIDNNKRLTMFNSELKEVNETLTFNRNGRDQLAIMMPQLESVGVIDIRNVKSFRAPRLEASEGEIAFNQCDELESISFPNITKTGAGVTIINNKKLANVTFPKLKDIGGSLRIVNNTELIEVGGFPKLETCEDINMGGNFEEIDFPKLDTVRGTSKVSSTTEEESVCEFFEGRAKDDNVVGAENECTFKNEQANQGGDTEGGSSTGGGSSDDADAAGLVSVNSAMLGLALVAGLAQLL